MKKIFTVEAIQKSPICVNSGVIENDGVNMTIVKRNGIPYIPGSSLKGKVRYNFSRIVGDKGSHKEKAFCSCPVCLVFGGAGNNQSRIFFDDLVPDERSSGNVGIRYGVAIDRYTKTSNDKFLYTREVAEDFVFKGDISLYYDDKMCHSKKPGCFVYENELLLSIKMIEAIGGGNSSGFGFVELKVREKEVI
ncbi:MAG: hypothetical protein GX270_10170 [Clostridiaceae bacterium]|nr:hypothetical protein [Clostridiaceae bacterium]